jgi:hypothetical protein
MLSDTNGDALARVDAEHVVAVANAVIRARRHDALGTALGLLTIATMLAGDDPQMKTTVAVAMIRTALELDPHVSSVQWH